jgi:type IV secretory pathway TraG/TraD family ATPase VirD4
MQNLMTQVFARKKKCIIYDQSGDLYKAHFRPGKDVFFNPGLTGSVPWSIFSEMKYVYDANTLAQAFLPPKGGVAHGASAFFEDAARALFSVILLRLAQNGAQNTSDIAKAFLEMPEEEMESLIANSVASSAIGGDSKGQRQGVISSISIYLDGIAAVENGSWSIRDFIERDDDSRLYVLGTEDTNAMFAPLYRLVLAIAFAVIASKQEAVFEDKYWFFLDECHTLGDIKLDEKLATLGKYGVAILSGVQSESQFMTSIGQERGQTVMNCFNTVLMLRMNEPSMMERAAKRLGMQDMETVSQNQALAVTEWRDGAGMARTQQERWLVMPSEFGSLAACEGFIKLSGNYPAGRVDYTQWIAKQWIGPNYADQFRPKQDTPPRNPKFLLTRAYAAGSVDPIAIVSQKLKEEKNAKAAEASAAATSTVAPTTTSAAASSVVAKASAAPKAGGTGKARLRLVPAATKTPENSAAPQTSLAPMQADMFEGDLSSRPAAPPISTAQVQITTHLRDMQQSADGIEPLPSKDLGDRDFERLDF